MQQEELLGKSKHQKNESEAQKLERSDELYQGEVDKIEIKEHNFTKGKHYYEIEDIKKRSIVCTSCPIRHGGILESKHLIDYRVEDGVLYFKDKAINETP